MKKRCFALLLALCLLGTLCVLPASALSEDDAAVQTVRALGIMTGDGYGNLNLEANVTRAQFAKLLVAASRHKDSISPDGTGYSLYKDVKSSHWASEYIRIAAQEGWMIGYTDGTFRPENPIALEETCSAVLKLLGYTQLAGSFPYAQLSKASALGLRDGVARVRGDRMTRADCAQMFYNLLTAENSAGVAYATTLGYTVANGEVDYTAVILDNVSGPYVAPRGAALPFAPAVVYRDGRITASTALAENEVYYYSRALNSAWIYSKRASGRIEAVSSGSGGTPTAVTISGKTYAVGASSAAFRLSALSGTGVDSYVTLLLGMNDTIAGVLTGSAVNGTYYGVVQASTRTSSGSGREITTDLTVFCTDGTTRSFSLPRTDNHSVDSAVVVTVTDNGAEVGRAASSRLSGKINAAATQIGDYRLAENAHIIDTATDGTAVAIESKRLANATLQEKDVRFFSLNKAGEIEHLILSDATGDTRTYAYLTEIKSGSDTSLMSGSGYTWLVNGKSISSYDAGVTYAVNSIGGIALIYEQGGTTLRNIRMLSSAPLTNINADASTATANDRTRPLAENVQVYLRQDSSYYQVKASTVNTNDYVLTGWYDDFGCSAGGQIRIIIATPQS